jgi:hypothetical protein
LASTLNVDEWSVSHPGRLTPGKDHQYTLNGRLGWVGIVEGLGLVRKGKGTEIKKITEGMEG